MIFLPEHPEPPQAERLFTLGTPSTPFTYCGVPFIEAPSRIVPILQLREDAPVTDAFRKEMNAWLLDTFGVRDESVIPIGQVLMFNGNILGRKETIDRLRNAVKATNCC